MRNSKTINLAIASMMLIGFTACSSDDTESTPQQLTTSLGAPLVENNTTGRVILLNGSTAAKSLTRAVPTTAPKTTLSFDEFTKPAYTTPYQGDATLTANSVYGGNWQALTASLNLNGNNLYVNNKSNELTLTGISGTGTIYVGGSGTLKLQGVSSLNNVKIVVFKGGKLIVDGVSNFTIGSGAGIYAELGLYKQDPTGTDTNSGEKQTFYGINLTNNGDLLTPSELHVNGLTLGAGSKTSVGTNLTAEGNANVQGDLNVGNVLTTGTDLAISGADTKVVVNSLITTKKHITVDAASVYGSVIKAGAWDDTENESDSYIHQTNGSQIYIGTNGMLNTYTYENTDATAKLNLEGTLGVLAVKNLVVPSKTEASFITTADGGKMGVCFKNAYAGSVSEANEADWDELTFVGGANVVKVQQENEYAFISIPANEELGLTGFNAAGEGAAEAGYMALKEVANVLYSTNEAERENLSATCVQVSNGKVYVSYHTNGSAQAGMLDVLTPSGNTVTLNQSISAVDNSGVKNVIDWNHIIIDNNKVVGVGNSDKGGVLTTLDLKADGTFNTTATQVSADSTLEPLQYVILQDVNGHSGDGNAVIANGNYYQAATTYGTEVFDRTTLAKAYANDLGGRGKHIAIGDNNIAVSYFNGTVNSDQPNTPVEMKVNIYDKSSVRLNTPTSSFSVGQVWPTNGKNVLTYDGNDLYVCLGANGLARYTNGTLNGTFKPDYATYTATAANNKYEAGTTVTRGYCNGVAVKGNYVYVAYGSLGVIVLNKSDLSEVARFEGGKSANFVAVDDDNNIWVAYGKNRLRVFQLKQY